MTTKVESTIVVDVPVRAAYDQWTQFEDFPKFMGGVHEVRQVTDRSLHWVAEIAGVRREWDATILEQVPDVKVAWAATEGATNAGAVYFIPVEAGRTTVRLSLEYEPTGLLEHLGDKLHIVERQAKADLENFKTFIEGEGTPTGAWRGTIDEGARVNPGVQDAQATRDDDGKAGISPKAVVAGAAVAAAGVAAVRALTSNDEEEAPSTPAVPAGGAVVEEEVLVVEVPPVQPVVTDAAPSAGIDDDLPPRV